MLQWPRGPNDYNINFICNYELLNIKKKILIRTIQNLVYSCDLSSTFRTKSSYNKICHKKISWRFSWFVRWSISTMLCVIGGFEIFRIQIRSASDLAQQEWKKTDVATMNYEQFKYFRMAPPARRKCVSAENKIVWEWFDFRSFDRLGYGIGVR